MNRSHFMTVFCMGAISASIAVAASYQEAVIAQLRAQGYKKIVVETTLLGRVKISAVLKDGRREIILNPRTGEVLRDLWIGPDGDVSAPRIASANPGGGGSGGDNGGGGGDTDGGGDDTGDGDDNGGDDNGGDDNSGSGDSGGGKSGENDSDGGDDKDDSDGSDEGEDD